MKSALQAPASPVPARALSCHWTVTRALRIQAGVGAAGRERAEGHLDRDAAAVAAGQLAGDVGAGRVAGRIAARAAGARLVVVGRRVTAEVGTDGQQAATHRAAEIELKTRVRRGVQAGGAVVVEAEAHVVGGRVVRRQEAALDVNAGAVAGHRPCGRGLAGRRVAVRGPGVLARAEGRPHRGGLASGRDGDVHDGRARTDEPAVRLRAAGPHRPAGAGGGAAVDAGRRAGPGRDRLRADRHRPLGLAVDPGLGRAGVRHLDGADRLPGQAEGRRGGRTGQAGHLHRDTDVAGVPVGVRRSRVPSPAALRLA